MSAAAERVDPLRHWSSTWGPPLAQMFNPGSAPPPPLPNGAPTAVAAALSDQERTSMTQITTSGMAATSTSTAEAQRRMNVASQQEHHHGHPPQPHHHSHRNRQACSPAQRDKQLFALGMQTAFIVLLIYMLGTLIVFLPTLSRHTRLGPAAKRMRNWWTLLTVVSGACLGWYVFSPTVNEYRRGKSWRDAWKWPEPCNRDNSHLSRQECMQAFEQYLDQQARTHTAS